MNKMRMLCFGAFMLTLGYLLGVSGAGFQQLTAQEGDAGVSEDAANKIRAAYRALGEAKEALIAEGRYETITDGTNAFMILAGGGSAKDDLESGRGVDPETFAALYAGKALPEVAELLDSDDSGRITYNKEVVRLYSKARLEKIFADRIKINEVSN